MQQLPEELRENVRILGDLLGDTIAKHEGEGLLEKVEEIRRLSKQLASDEAKDYGALKQLLNGLEDKDILPITRAFNQFLNLANIADLEYFSGASEDTRSDLKPFVRSLVSEHSKDTVLNAIKNLRIDLVLTAHPTEVTRRTLIRKYDGISRDLTNRSREDLVHYEKAKVDARLNRLVSEVWNTDEIRVTRPTAVDEAKWGFAVIENSLWHSVPNFIRSLSQICDQELGAKLPLDMKPFRFFSWMGGDRDGNPNVTHKVTEEVILLGRWQAADLYLRDLEELGNDLSMHEASEELLALLDTSCREPYRALINKLRKKLEKTLTWIEEKLEGKHQGELEPADIIHNKNEILEPLLLLHKSLCDKGFECIAGGPLTNTIYRLQAFSINLVPLDVRQDGERHVQALDELTQYLDLGNYKAWSEEERQAFLLEQLKSKRPILPRSWPASDDTIEVLKTCEVIAQQPQECLSHYVISMAQQPSDVLAVALLLKETGITWQMPVSPLFETLDDLDRAPKVMSQLWQMPWYQDYTQGHQTIMIGYSDSAKDAGKFMATWAQYKSQESLVELAEQNDVNLVLFHGRGGTVGRGGGPVEKAMASQPPGSVKGKIRVTEQGEMIRYKFGMPRAAFASFATYTTACLKATLNPSPKPKDEWRELIENMAQASLVGYRRVVREHPQFVPFFRALTPEQALNKLALGSRPAKRKATGGVESLRAIPWVFAWTQVRLNMPSWLGAKQALDHALENSPELLHDMLQNWDFFSSFIDLLEMVLGKADAAVCLHYENELVEPELRELGEQLRAELGDLETQLNKIKGQEKILDSDPFLQRTLALRKPYIDPLNYLQAELLKRDRREEKMSHELEQALKVTMAGISAGMRNTG